MSIIKSNAVAPPPSGGLSSISEMNSLRFDGSSYLSKTPTTAGNRKTWTWSGWVKIGNPNDPRVFSAGTSTNKTEIALSSTFVFRYRTSSNNYYVQTSAKFRDHSAWYHVFVAIDTTQATGSDRVKLYINGEQITDFGNEGYPPQNADMHINSTSQHNIGYLTGTSTTFFDGYLANIHFIDGQALDHNSFGETISDIWVPKAYGSGDPSNASQVLAEYGTNGFHLDFAASNMDFTNSKVLDASGRGNDWTLN